MSDVGSITKEIFMGRLNRTEMGSLNKSENSCTKPNGSASESQKTPPSSDFEETSLTPSTLTFSALKYQVDQEGVEVQSPDWESFFSDQLEGDFMISSPKRNISSPQASKHDYSYNCTHAMHTHGVLGCSPPRMSSPLGLHGSAAPKGKGLNPLRKVFNSPDNQSVQIGSLSLPPLENLLDGYGIDNDFVSYSTLKTSGVGSSSGCFDPQTTVPTLLDCLESPNSATFCGLSRDTLGHQGGSQLNQEGSVGSTVTTPLSQQLEQEPQQEKQQLKRRQQQLPPQSHSVNHTLMAPQSVGPEQKEESGLQLVHLLLACAEAVAKEDYILARRYLNHLNSVVTPLGDSMQRVASCFTEALSARVTATLTTKPTTSTPKSFSPFPPNSPEILKIYQILYQTSPYIKFAHFTANQAIFEAFEGKGHVHIIDLDILQGYQWPAFMQALAARPGGPPFLRITGVCPSPELVNETGRCLTEFAQSLHIPFEFHTIAEQLEDIKAHMLNRRVGEALAVNSVNRLHRVQGNCLGNILTVIRDQVPNIVTMVEQEASHNGPYFLGRFLEALHYYSAIFDSLDATFPPDSAHRAKVEQYIFAREIRNIVACEGPERVMRHERLEKWKKIMEGRAFRGVALSANAVTQSKILLGMYSCEGYRLTEDKGCLLLGWQDRVILAASAWRC